MNLKIFIIIIIIFLVSCNTKSKDKSIVPAEKMIIVKNEKHSIAILPFDNIDSNLIKELKNGLQKQMAVEITVLNNISIPDFAFYKPRQRYIADSLLVFLKQINKSKAEKIIGITTKDISTRKGNVENWGILGLGACPGQACVVSTFRAGKNKVAYKYFCRRIITLSLHELGHTYGLEHCPVETCLMKDAEGKMNLDDGDSYCNKCKNYLLSNGISKSP